MNRKEFVEKLNERVKLIRTEYAFNQEQMAYILGISKKTLVEIEKGRSSLGWTGAVAVCTLFSESEILSGIFGGAPTDMIIALAFEENEPRYPKTMGGKVWWRILEEYDGYKLQQNIVSQHYRILNQENKRMRASFHYEQIQKQFDELRRDQ
ncbi:transcriptional regulator [Sinanaerobacter sp. ZZT-01]|uniref:helix-turn-helix transcriptional regulator n=1 Tax=Sinanaerobacter sp. ZZT-01 TaxID=3111540 RepID=UPI002D77C26E|nr:transcriptional regulator [Sinanaerobacter sp. ZZT-01]WRR94360.1 transcriptional regulator [Sinanaerobacter sp. ZZT-01]